MANPNETMKGGFGASAEAWRERQAARKAPREPGAPADETGVPATAPLTRIANAAARATRPRPNATRADKTTTRPPIA